ncbi:MAG: glycine zipper domain-containing protein [Candidatus Methylomirabilis sp.]
MRRRMVIGLLLLVLVAGCATPLTPRESGTLAGASIGAATGAILGGVAGSAGKGAALGAVVGAISGALVGDAVQHEQAAMAYSPGYAYAPPPHRYHSPYPPPPNATLQIEATPEDTEIVVDGRRIGLAKEFRGPALVPVLAGPHHVEFRWQGFSVVSRITVPLGATVPIRRDMAPSASASP